jgi:hypothetical protein
MKMDQTMLYKKISKEKPERVCFQTDIDGNIENILRVASEDRI